MRFLHGKVKARKGETINIEISKPTRVLVMTRKNFEKYKNNLTFTYYGGQKEGVYAFEAPKDGEWYCVVEKGSYADPANISASLSKTSASKPAPRIKASKTADVEEATPEVQEADETSEEEEETEE